MPEFILPEEADHCPHCGAVLVDPPKCCEAMQAEHRQLIDWERAEEEQEYLDAVRWFNKGHAPDLGD